MRWRRSLEDFHPTFHYTKGANNALADALSGLPRHDEGEEVSASRNKPYTNAADMSQQTSQTFSIIDEPELLQCYLNLPDVDHEHPFALDYATIAAKQLTDDRIQALLITKPQSYAPTPLSEGSPDVVCYHQSADKLRICIPDSMVEEVVRFYHAALVHPGRSRMLSSIQQHLENPKFEATVDRVVDSCEPCLCCKPPGKGYGHLPARNPITAPWYEIAVDLVGPWTMRNSDGNDHEFMALTIIDTVTNLCEIVPIRNKTAAHIGLLLENQWIARYPSPKKCMYDQGNEFLGAEFQKILQRNNIEPAPAATKNPQANSNVERLHQTIASSLRLLSYAHPPRNEAEREDMVNTALQTASYAAKAAIHSTMKLSPGAIAFGRDMLLNIPVIADFEHLRNLKEALINKNLLRENRRRVSHDYQPGDVVYKLVFKPHKMEPRATGPYTITRAHTNGSVTMQLNADTTERINIRRIKPSKA